MRGKPNLAAVKPLDADGKPLAAFCTTGIDHIATAAGFHPSAEAMGSGAFDFARLIRSFHSG
jgi:hypothetical protein